MAFRATETVANGVKGWTGAKQRQGKW